MTAQDRPVEIFENASLSKQQVLFRLRRRAHHLWEKRQRPISVNDIRPLLEKLNYQGDHRILGAVFSRKEWRPVARTQTKTPGCEAFGVTRQAIQLYVPRNTED
jgi:hypothetical protein